MAVQLLLPNFAKKKKKNNPLVQGLSLVVVAAVSPFLSLFFVQAVFFRAT